MIPGGAVEARHLVLLTTSGQVRVAACGLCGALVEVDRDGELRHLVLHEQGGQLGDDQPPAA